MTLTLDNNIYSPLFYFVSPNYENNAPCRQSYLMWLEYIYILLTYWSCLVCNKLEWPIVIQSVDMFPKYRHNLHFTKPQNCWLQQTGYVLFTYIILIFLRSFNQWAINQCHCFKESTLRPWKAAPVSLIGFRAKGIQCLISSCKLAYSLEV